MKTYLTNLYHLIGRMKGLMKSNVRHRDTGVTFEIGGFVSARSRPTLLARHDYEILYIKKFLGDMMFESSLEVGCGYGRLSPFIAQHAKKSFAIDVNKSAFSLARDHYKGVEFDIQDITNLPYNKNKFDLVTTWTVLQHLSPQVISIAASEIRRVIRDNGVILMCEATRYPGSSGGHTWDRTVQDYKDMFSDFSLVKESYIQEVDSIEGMETPGRVMLFNGKN